MYQEGSPGNKIPWWAEAEESSGQGKGSSDDGRVSQLFHSDINSILIHQPSTRQPLELNMVDGEWMMVL